MNIQTNQNQQKGINIPFMVTLVVICLAIIGHSVWGHRESSGNLAYDVGSTLPFAVLIAGALYLIFKSKIDSASIGTSFIAIFLSFFFACYIAVGRHQAESSSLKEKIHGAMGKIQDSFKNGETPDQISGLSGSGNSDTDKMGKILERIFNYSIQQQKEYKYALEQSGLFTLLSAERLSKDRNLTESMQIVSKGKSIVDQYKNATDEMFAKMRSEIEHSDVSATNKQGMLRGFDKSMPKSRENAIRIWEYEAEMLKTMESLIADLRKNRQRWTVQNGQLVFSSSAALEAYNEKLAEIDQLNKAEESLRSSMFKTANEKFNKL